MIAKPSDMTPIVDLTYGKGTGPIRCQRPIYVDLLPPCNNACPAGHVQARSEILSGRQIHRPRPEQLAPKHVHPISHSERQAVYALVAYP